LTKVSVLVPTLDEERNLAECLASCAFADEIVVVDSGSRDATAAIAKRLGARVLVNPFESHARQKNWGLARVSNDWVLTLDADERVTPELAEEIRDLLRAEPPRAGYRIRRRNTFLGREIRGCGWQRDRVLRLFDRRRARFDDRRVHESVRVDGDVGALRGSLSHRSCRDLGQWLRKVERYAELGAAELHARGRRAGPADLIARPPARFVKQWLLQAGFRDGCEGWILCATSAYGVLLKYARLYELGRAGGPR
jgi:glycosyltransferase involved in cell wall biosynthesis